MYLAEYMIVRADRRHCGSDIELYCTFKISLAVLGARRSGIGCFCIHGVYSHMLGNVIYSRIF